MYTVDTWGPPVGAGATAPRYCTLNGVAKVLPAGSPPYMVANEYICARVGSLIGLPVPPGVIVQTPSHQLGYVALRFGSAGERPPRVIPNELVTDHPELAAGILTLDCWVANDDRHEENIAYSRGAAWPVAVFDHSHAFFGAPGDPARLHNFARDFRPGVLGQHVTEPALFEEWVLRIQSVRPGVIEEIVGSLAARSILTSAEAEAARDFLVHRQASLPELLSTGLPGVQWR